MTSFIFNIILFVVLIGCTSNSSTPPSNQARLLNSVNVPEYIQELDSLTVFSSDSKPLSSIQFIEEQSFGEIYPALLPPSIGFGPVTAVDRYGNVYLADKGRKTIHVYNPDGSLLTDIGREGRGPGEFMGITTIRIHHNKLFVYDSNLTRIQVFTLNPLELSRTIIPDSQQWNKFEEVHTSIPYTIFGLTDSTFLAGILLNNRHDRSYYGYYMLDWEGNVISDKVVEQQRLQMHRGTLDNGGVSVVQLPFTSKGIVDAAQDGTIYHTNTWEFLIKIYNSRGDFQRAIYYPYDKNPLEKEEALKQFHPNIHKIVRNINFPDTWPALESMFLDDENRIWMSTIIDDKEVYEWWILENSGKLVAKFTWPSDESIEVVRNGRMYVGTKDEEARVQRVVRYSVVVN